MNNKLVAITLSLVLSITAICFAEYIGPRVKTSNEDLMVNYRS